MKISVVLRSLLAVSSVSVCLLGPIPSFAQRRNLEQEQRNLGFMLRTNRIKAVVSALQDPLLADFVRRHAPNQVFEQVISARIYYQSWLWTNSNQLLNDAQSLLPTNVTPNSSRPPSTQPYTTRAKETWEDIKTDRSLRRRQRELLSLAHWLIIHHFCDLRSKVEFHDPKRPYEFTPQRGSLLLAAIAARDPAIVKLLMRADPSLLGLSDDSGKTVAQYLQEAPPAIQRMAQSTAKPAEPGRSQLALVSNDSP